MTDAEAIRLLDMLDKDTPLGILVSLVAISNKPGTMLPTVTCVPIVDVVLKDGGWYIKIDGGLGYAASTFDTRSVVQLVHVFPKAEQAFSNN